MTDFVNPAAKRGLRREGSAAARNASTLLIDPLDSQHIVGVEETTLPDGVPAVSARVSFDGGGSWRESWPLPLERNWSGVVGPVLAIDAHGTLNLAALALDPGRSRASLVVYLSEDGGIHWTFPTVVLQGTAECCYSVVADLNPASPFRGNVYLTADMGNALCFARSTGGQSWSGVGKAKPGPFMAGLCFNPEVLVGPGGAVHVVWMTGPSGCSILAAASPDGGCTFGAPVTVAEGIVGVQEGLPQTAPATCFGDDGLALCVWADDREGRARIYRRRSTDGGLTWEGPLAGKPLIPGPGGGQHEFQPHLLVTAAGEICCAFYEYGPKTPGGELLVDLAMSVSYDRGVTFANRTILSERPWDPAVERPLSRGATRGALGWLAVG
ncbi:MAG TPA: sialidase family protein [Bryobacteraceae bacterium]|nr:sialidase family protein [Bryobacteraceae bacterium]